jgi:3-phenylpropionate/cinnamic acid dioxygenase small subunit
MSDAALREVRIRSVHELLAREATLMDERRWDEWLQLFSVDAEYWVPSWDSDSELTDDPASQLSLIYYPGRFGLEDRVYRLRSGNSAASLPLPRTCHMVSCVLPEFHDDGSCTVTANWNCNVYRSRQTATFYGSYRYLLEAEGDSWLIRKKRIVLMNDAVPTPIDIYSL